MDIFEKLYNDPILTEKYKELYQDSDYYYLYKFYSIDPELNILKMFDKFNMRYRSSKYFNDPYDCHFNIEIDETLLDESYYSSYYTKMMSTPDINFFTNLSLEELIKRGVKCHTNKYQVLLNLRVNTFLTCFNNSPKNILMWSHYANNHNGFMIEFKIPKKEHNNLLPLPVEYSQKIKKIKYTTDVYELNYNSEGYFNVIRDGFLVKGNHWQYENEFRLFGNLQSSFLSSHEYHDLPFPPEYISSICLGSEVIWHQDIKNAFLRCLNKFNSENNLDIKLYSVEADHYEFKINFPDHPILGK